MRRSSVYLKADGVPERDDPGVSERSDVEQRNGDSITRPALTDAQAESLLTTKRITSEPSTRMASTYFGLLAEFGGEAHIPLEKVAPKYFGLSFKEARRNASAKLLPCRAFKLGGQKSPWLVSAIDLAEVIDRQRSKAW